MRTHTATRSRGEKTVRRTANGGAGDRQVACPDRWPVGDAVPCITGCGSTHAARREPTGGGCWGLLGSWSGRGLGGCMGCTQWPRALVHPPGSRSAVALDEPGRSDRFTECHGDDGDRRDPFPTLEGALPRSVPHGTASPALIRHPRFLPSSASPRLRVSPRSGSQRDIRCWKASSDRMVAVLRSQDLSVTGLDSC